MERKKGESRTKNNKMLLTLNNLNLSPDEYIKAMSQYLEFLNNPVRKERIKGRFII